MDDGEAPFLYLSERANVGNTRRSRARELGIEARRMETGRERGGRERKREVDREVEQERDGFPPVDRIHLWAGRFVCTNVAGLTAGRQENYW